MPEPAAKRRSKVSAANDCQQQQQQQPPGACDIGLSVTGIDEPIRKQRRLQLLQRRRPPEARDMCADSWRLDNEARSHEAVLLSPTAVLFHPRWSNGHAAARGQQELHSSLTHYWEVTFGERVFGTAMQVGVCNRLARLHADEFSSNLIGQDEHSWGLSHQGVAWHDGECRRLCEPFPENQPCVVGVLLDAARCRLSFFKDGRPLGCAFDNVRAADGGPLYPVLSSTAAKTCMSVTKQLRSYASLQDRCCAVAARHAGCRSQVLRTDCRLPPAIRRILLQRL